jgi:hypothetical protein
MEVSPHDDQIAQFCGIVKTEMQYCADWSDDDSNLSSRMSSLPVGKGPMRKFKELVAPARGYPDLESILPDDFDLASVRCNPAMDPPDKYSRDGFNRFDGGKRGRLYLK